MVSQQPVILAALRKLSLEDQDYKASFGKSQTQPQKGLELSSYTLSLATSTILSHSHFSSPGLVQSLSFSLYSRLFGCLSVSLSPCPKQQHNNKKKTISPKMECSGGRFLYCTPSHTRKLKGNFGKVLCVTREAQIAGIGRLTHDHTVGLGLFFPSVKSRCHSHDSNSFSQNICFLESSKTNREK